MLHLTHAEWEEIRRAWEAGNEESQGSAFGDDGDSPLEAVTRESYEAIAVAEDGSVLAHSKHKHYYFVRESNGPWGVDVTLAVRAILGDDIPAQA